MSLSLRTKLGALAVVTAVMALLSPAPVQSRDCWVDIFAVTCYYSNGYCVAACNQGYCLNEPPEGEESFCEQYTAYCC